MTKKIGQVDSRLLICTILLILKAGVTLWAPQRLFLRFFLYAIWFDLENLPEPCTICFGSIVQETIMRNRQEEYQYKHEAVVEYLVTVHRNFL